MSERKAYVQFGKAGEPMQTIACELKITGRPKPFRNQSGYSRKTPTDLMLKLNGKWRRIYAYQMSNAVSLFIGNGITTGQIVNVDY